MPFLLDAARRLLAHRPRPGADVNRIPSFYSCRVRAYRRFRQPHVVVGQVPLARGGRATELKIYCESLPCPCSTEAGGGDVGGGDGQDESCTKPDGVQRLVFSKRKYPNIRRHFRRALRRGWPRRLVLNRPGADARRDRLLEDIPRRDGYDRDEYPPAVGRGKGKGLTRGRKPRGWKADVRYVPSSENRSHGAPLGAKLADFCTGTRFRYVFR
jgi:hypothetical protein